MTNQSNRVCIEGDAHGFRLAVGAFYVWDEELLDLMETARELFGTSAACARPPICLRDPAGRCHAVGAALARGPRAA